MRGKLLAVLIGASLVLAACGGKEDSSSNADTVTVADGERVYKENSCAACHGADLKGGRSNPDLTTVGAKYTKEEIEQIILEGKGGMPPRIVEGAEAAAVAEWLSEKK